MKIVTRKGRLNNTPFYRYIELDCDTYSVFLKKDSISYILMELFYSHFLEVNDIMEFYDYLIEHEQKENLMLRTPKDNLINRFINSPAAIIGEGETRQEAINDLIKNKVSVCAYNCLERPDAPLSKEEKLILGYIFIKTGRRELYSSSVEYHEDFGNSYATFENIKHDLEKENYFFNDNVLCNIIQHLYENRYIHFYDKKPKYTYENDSSPIKAFKFYDEPTTKRLKKTTFETISNYLFFIGACIILAQILLFMTNTIEISYNFILTLTLGVANCLGKITYMFLYLIHVYRQNKIDKKIKGELI